jgi:hypothetical protein
MRLSMPNPSELAAMPVMASLPLLEAALVVVADALRADADLIEHLDHGQDDLTIMARVLSRECQGLRRLLTTYRRRLLTKLRRERRELDYPF